MIGDTAMSRQTTISRGLIEASAELCRALEGLEFAAPTTHVYNPLEYARRANEQYIRRFGRTRKRCVMMGMNPGPWGMAQTGIPFGEIPAVRDWMGIEVKIDKPPGEHPKRPVEGFACQRSEVSGRRLWGLFSDRFGDTILVSLAGTDDFCPLRVQPRIEAVGDGFGQVNPGLCPHSRSTCRNT